VWFDKNLHMVHLQTSVGYDDSMSTIELAEVEKGSDTRQGRELSAHQP
jgi:hypothetical protein